MQKYTLFYCSWYNLLGTTECEPYVFYIRVFNEERRKMIEPFSFYIDKERRETIYFFELFLKENTKHKTLAFAEIQSALDVSAYKLERIISDAEILSKEIGQLDVSYCKNTSVTVLGLDTVKHKQIILYEVSHSLNFKVFLHLMLNIDNYSAAEFQEKNGISRATYFRIKGELKKNIGPEHIHFIKTSEAHARIYVYKVLYYFSYFEFAVPKNDRIKLQQIFKYTWLLLKLKLTNSQYKQYKYFISINYWRNKMGHKMSATSLPYLVEINSNVKEIHQFIEHLPKPLAKTKTGAYRIARIFANFLLSTQALSVEQLSYSLQDYSQVEELTQQQLTIVHDFIGMIPPENNALKNRLLLINVKMLIPFLLDASYHGTKKSSFYEKSYPHISQLTKLLLQKRIDFKEARPLHPREKTELYYSYLFAIFCELPVSYFSDKVHIAVYFSQGKEYTDFIKKKINDLSLLNLEIDQFVNSKTDIYITNNFDPSFKNKQIVLDQPPVPEDLLQLRELIIHVKKGVK